MLKKYSIVSFILLTIIAILGILLCVCPFSVPTSTSKYNGFLNAIDKGIDLNGGVTAIYNCELSGDSKENLDTLIDNSLIKIKNLFEKEKYSEINIEKQGENKIRVEVSNTISDAQNFTFLKSGKSLSFTTEQVSDEVLPTIYMNGLEIIDVNVYYDYESESYGFKFTFSDLGLNQLQDLKERANLTTDKKIYIYLGELNTNNTLGEISTSDIDGKTISFTISSTGSYGSSSTEITETLYNIVGGNLGYDISLIETSDITPILGQNTLLYIGIAFLITIIILFICMIIRYGTLGLLANLSIIFSIIIFLFLMQAIPFITLNLAGIFGCILALLLFTISSCIVLEKIKEEYALGKKIHLACKGGIKKSLWPILDSHFIIILSNIMIWIFAPSSMKIFGITLIISALISLFTSLVVLKYLIRIYLPINSTNAKVMHLYREKNVRELKDEEIVIKDVITNPEQGGENL